MLVAIIECLDITRPSLWRLYATLAAVLELRAQDRCIVFFAIFLVSAVVFGGMELVRRRLELRYAWNQHHAAMQQPYQHNLRAKS